MAFAHADTFATISTPTGKSWAAFRWVSKIAMPTLIHCHLEPHISKPVSPSSLSVADSRHRHWHAVRHHGGPRDAPAYPLVLLQPPSGHVLIGSNNPNHRSQCLKQTPQHSLYRERRLSSAASPVSVSCSYHSFSLLVFPSRFGYTFVSLAACFHPRSSNWFGVLMDTSTSIILGRSCSKLLIQYTNIWSSRYNVTMSEK